MNWERIKKIKPGVIFILILIVMIIVGSYNGYMNEQSLAKNNSITFGKVTKIKYGRHGYIGYKFYVNGEPYEASDPDDASWPEYVRTGNPILNSFYKVEYDSKKPSNSKIKIYINSISAAELLQEGITIEATVAKVSKISDSYVDLYISYTYNTGNFDFRTRLHKDSLPCGSITACASSKIDLVIANDFPELNNLYDQSYDRRSLKKAKQKRSENF